MKTKTDKASNCYCAYCKCNRAFIFDCISDHGVEKHRCLACGHLGQATPKQKLFKTARAVIGCAKFDAGDWLAIKHYGQGPSGIHWFIASRSRAGLLIDDLCVAYPEHHLTDFVL